jgi:hypothetical protein
MWDKTTSSICDNRTYSDTNRSNGLFRIKENKFCLVFQLFSVSNFRTLTEIDKQVVFKLFELSINRYSEVSLINLKIFIIFKLKGSSSSTKLFIYHSLSFFLLLSNHS